MGGLLKSTSYSSATLLDLRRIQRCRFLVLRADVHWLVNSHLRMPKLQCILEQSVGFKQSQREQSLLQLLSQWTNPDYCSFQCLLLWQLLLTDIPLMCWCVPSTNSQKHFCYQFLCVVYWLGYLLCKHPSHHRWLLDHWWLQFRRFEGLRSNSCWLNYTSPSMREIFLIFPKSWCGVADQLWQLLLRMFPFFSCSLHCEDKHMLLWEALRSSVHQMCWILIQIFLPFWAINFLKYMYDCMLSD